MGRPWSQMGINPVRNLGVGGEHTINREGIYGTYPYPPALVNYYYYYYYYHYKRFLFSYLQQQAT